MLDKLCHDHTSRIPSHSPIIQGVSRVYAVETERTKFLRDTYPTPKPSRIMITLRLTHLTKFTPLHTRTLIVSPVTLQEGIVDHVLHGATLWSKWGSWITYDRITVIRLDLIRTLILYILYIRIHMRIYGCTPPPIEGMLNNRLLCMVR